MSMWFSFLLGSLRLCFSFECPPFVCGIFFSAVASDPFLDGTAQCLEQPHTPVAVIALPLLWVQGVWGEVRCLCPFLSRILFTFCHYVNSAVPQHSDRLFIMVLCLFPG